MAEQFQDNARNLRYACLAVIGFLELTSGPLRRNMLQVCCYLGLNPVRQIAVGLFTVSSITELQPPFIVMSGINDQCADDGRVIAAVLSVSMEGKTQINRCFLRIHPHRAAFHIVFVFIPFV